VRWKWPLVQLAGLAAMATGFGLLALWAGLATGGAGLVVAGLVGEMGGPRT
jgi:hypothetical protein